MSEQSIDQSREREVRNAESRKENSYISTFLYIAMNLNLETKGSIIITMHSRMKHYGKHHTLIYSYIIHFIILSIP